LLGTAITSQLVAELQLSVGMVFFVSAATKLRNPIQTARAVSQYRLLPSSIAYAVGIALIPLEIFLALAFLSDSFIQLAAVVAPFVLAAFMYAVGANLWRGRSVPCGCFGDSSEQISPRTLTRLGMLLLAATVVLFGQVGILRTQQPWGNVATTPGLLLTAENFLVAVCLIVFAMWVLRAREVLLVMRVALAPRGSDSAGL
jgi:putative oxidoreductase